MTIETRSEGLFERWCHQRHLEYRRIPTDQGERRADYRVLARTCEWIAEVKEFTPNAQDRLAKKQLDANVLVGVHEVQSRSRIVSKIKSSAGQLRTLCREGIPGVLILYSPPGIWPEVTQPYAIMTAMYGLEKVALALHPEASYTVVDRGFGPKRHVGPDRNRWLSAIGAMELRRNGRVRLAIFHNEFATVRLHHGCIPGRGIRHFAIGAKVPLAFQDWAQVK
jgi:hypothetical protein